MVNVGFAGSSTFGRAPMPTSLPLPSRVATGSPPACENSSPCSSLCFRPVHDHYAALNLTAHLFLPPPPILVLLLLLAYLHGLFVFMCLISVAHARVVAADDDVDDEEVIMFQPAGGGMGGGTPAGGPNWTAAPPSAGSSGSNTTSGSAAGAGSFPVVVPAGSFAEPTGGGGELTILHCGLRARLTPSGTGSHGDRGEVRPGDWECPSCGVNVYGSRSACFRCRTAKPGESTQRIQTHTAVPSTAQLKTFCSCRI